MKQLCELHAAVGNAEECPGGWCAFWEHGSGVVEAGCALQRMKVDLRNRDVAYHLLELRRSLEDVRSAEDARKAAASFSQVRPPGL